MHRPAHPWIWKACWKMSGEHEGMRNLVIVMNGIERELEVWILLKFTAFRKGGVG
jgi:hypothetical protein